MDQRFSAGAPSAKTPSRDACRSDPTASPLQWRRNSNIATAFAATAVSIVFVILRRHSVSYADAYPSQPRRHISHMPTRTGPQQRRHMDKGETAPSVFLTIYSFIEKRNTSSRRTYVFGSIDVAALPPILTLTCWLSFLRARRG
jgi:hypothetical protein